MTDPLIQAYARIIDPLAWELHDAGGSTAAEALGISTEPSISKAQEIARLSGWREPEGWKLVPVEITDEMVDDFNDELDIGYEGDVPCVDNIEHLWRVMLKAAPLPPAPVFSEGAGNG